MRELLLTLGHNSSAILLEDGEVQWGYETERVTGVKSDSRFPLEHLERWGAQVGRIDLAYVTHWAPDGNLSSMSAKHWDPLYGLEGVPIVTLNPDPMAGRTHHDTHMHAALRYADSIATFPREGSYGVVIDGFGTCGEHLSVYELSTGQPKLVRRVHGYETSLGLWYQYATAFMGMKMHEDEYKLLGYEAHVDAEQWWAIRSEASVTAFNWLDTMHSSVFGSRYDPLYDVKALAHVKESVFRRLTNVCHRLGVHDPSSFEGRVVMSCYVQAVLEKIVCGVVAQFNPTNLVLSGGVFYNVKLNNVLLRAVTGQVCVYPLAGDQGNALGLYAKTHPEWVFPYDLYWGKRVLRDAGDVEGLHCGSEDEVYLHVVKQLRSVGFVNLVRGSMEFGPRALCNTSTLALPTMENVRRINAMNDRNTVMPMAPVMNVANYVELFEDTDRVWGSERHMIMAMRYRTQPNDSYRGVSHSYTCPDWYSTGRPQVVDRDDEFMCSLLDEFGGVLINTSFNYHGKPIALGMDSVVSNHLEERRRDSCVTTAVITGETE